MEVTLKLRSIGALFVLPGEAGPAIVTELCPNDEKMEKAVSAKPRNALIPNFWNERCMAHLNRPSGLRNGKEKKFLTVNVQCMNRASGY